MPDHVTTWHPKYHSHLMSLIEYIDSCTYSKDHVFTMLQLSAITPTHVKNWLELKVYGVINPGPDNQPAEGRSS